MQDKHGVTINYFYYFYILLFFHLFVLTLPQLVFLSRSFSDKVRLISNSLITLANSFSFLFFSLFFEKEYYKQNPLILVLIVSQISPISSLSIYSVLLSPINSLTLAMNS